MFYMNICQINIICLHIRSEPVQSPNSELANKQSIFLPKGLFQAVLTRGTLLGLSVSFNHVIPYYKLNG